MYEILDSYRELEANAPERINPLSMAMAEDMFVRLDGWEWFVEQAPALAELARQHQFLPEKIDAFDDALFCIDFAASYGPAILSVIRACASILGLDVSALASLAGGDDADRVLAVLQHAVAKSQGQAALPENHAQIRHRLAIFSVYGFALYYVTHEGALPVLVE
ncbi:hypothetical protein [Zoogloea sp.]|uniref:hypothetical protein n=1 Tax=Zoogloea sp. TaxID=49181 RepID=UPI0035B1B5E8